MVATITFDDLVNACSLGQETFKRLFGQSVEVTLELAEKHCKDFDWNWAAENLLRNDNLFCDWWKFYRDEYQSYLEKCGDADRYFQNSIPDSVKCIEYLVQRRELFNSYKKAIARKFAEFYIQENS